MAKLLMIGTCPECGAEVTSRYPFQISICHCENPGVEVRLELAALVLPKRQMKKIEKISEFSGVTVEKLVDGLLKEAATAILRRLKMKEVR